jgi:hypothetical protein
VLLSPARWFRLSCRVLCSTPCTKTTMSSFTRQTYSIHRMQ